MTHFRPNNQIISDITVEKLIERFTQYNESRNKAKKTTSSYQGSLKQFEKYIGAETLADSISIEEIEAYRLHLVRRELSTATVNTYLTAVKAALRWGVKRGFVERAPEVEFLFVESSRPKSIFTDLEFKLLLKAASKESTILLRLRATAMLLTLHDSGMRASELCRARWNDLVHLEVDGSPAHVLTIEGAKRGGVRQVILSEAAWLAIVEYREEMKKPHGRYRRHKGTDPIWLFTSSLNLHEPLTTAGLRQMLSRLEENCEGEVVKCNPHKFRRTFATAWINQSEGKDSELLMTICGWKSPLMLKVYTSFQTRTLVRAARRHAPIGYNFSVAASAGAGAGAANGSRKSVSAKP